MRYLLTILFIAMLIPGALADKSYFYVAASEGIFRGDIDQDTGKLEDLKLESDVKEPGFLAFSPDRQFLYVAYDDHLSAFKVKPDGGLGLLNSKPSGGDGNCHIGVEVSGRNVYVANYGSGSIACFRIGQDGLIGDRTAFVQYTGSGPDKDRQTGPHAHSVYTDPEDRFLYSCDLGTDNVWIFKLDSARGTLTPNDPPYSKVPAGSGPRHLAFGSGGKFAYVVNEMGVSVTVFSRDKQSGSLTPIETVPTLFPGASPHGGFSAEIFFDPAGKWLYASNRGSETISVFAVARDGKLTLLQTEPSIAEWPRSFAIDPKGRWLIVAGENDHRLAVLKINPATGRLGPTDQTAPVRAPHCVLFVPRS